MNKPYSEFDETYFKTMLENNALYFNQHLKKFLKTKNFGILKNQLSIRFWGKEKIEAVAVYGNVKGFQYFK